MERMTEHYPGGGAGLKGITATVDAIDRLVDYEDTGMTPEEIRWMKAEFEVQLNQAIEYGDLAEKLLLDLHT
jgi:hypothetical protein